MTIPSRAGLLERIDLHPAPADTRRLVREGMERHPRQLPAWLLYDSEGSRLFEAICQQPEYGLTRIETALIETRAAELMAALGPGVLVEFGAGSARKVAPLLRAGRPAAYAALDISAEHLQSSCDALARAHPEVPVLSICCDYSTLEQLPDHPWLRGQRRLGFYPGSSIGNFSPLEAQRLLERFRLLLGEDSRLLIGIDQPKAVERLEAAYNDRAGISAAFALNLLRRLNRELQGNFEPGQFHYEARWQPEHSRIAMALISSREQTVTLAGERWVFRSGEPLITEYSVKYTPDAFVALAQRAGWRPAGRWSDPAEDLSLHLLQPGPTDPSQQQRQTSGQRRNSGTEP